ncbi:hypothetical protein BC828DRAFT_385855 [Blastocladiella britannica]|nr:hypothetical protein BC828DRAFT_385855 [Blastocladiella britannica]
MTAVLDDAFDFFLTFLDATLALDLDWIDVALVVAPLAAAVYFGALYMRPAEVHRTVLVPQPAPPLHPEAAEAHAPLLREDPAALVEPQGDGDVADPNPPNDDQNGQPDPAAAAGPEFPDAPAVVNLAAPLRRVGKKRAANLERKENLRRYREWQVSQQQDQESRRTAENAERDRIAEAKELEALDRERSRRKQEMAQLRRIEREQEQLDWAEAQKPSVYSMEPRVLAFIEARLVVNLASMAQELNVRLEELEVYIEDKIEEGEWMGMLDLDQGVFTYMDPSRVAMLRQQLEVRGKVPKREIMAILSDPTVQVPPIGRLEEE